MQLVLFLSASVFVVMQITKYTFSEGSNFPANAFKNVVFPEPGAPRRSVILMRKCITIFSILMNDELLIVALYEPTSVDSVPTENFIRDKLGKTHYCICIN